jgi:preprotein translocase subunit SecE
MLAVVAGVFVFLWQKGHLLRFAGFFRDTQEELKKCTWPTRDELMGSTVVVFVSIALLGVFTAVIDFVIAMIVRWLASL